MTAEKTAAEKPAAQKTVAEKTTAVTTETTAALHGAPASEPAAAPKPLLSAGVAADLEIWGKATDPATGGVFKRDKATGKVTFTDRAGKVTEVR